MDSSIAKRRSGWVTVGRNFGVPCLNFLAVGPGRAQTSLSVRPAATCVVEEGEFIRSVRARLNEEDLRQRYADPGHFLGRKPAWTGFRRCEPALRSRSATDRATHNARVANASAKGKP
jgi:hypothetical protein